VQRGTARAAPAAVAPATKPAARAHSLDPLYRRIARDIKAGRPLVVTVHVALCDNGTIWCGNQRLGNGDNPRTNLYWGGAAGLTAYFRVRRGWKRVHRDAGDGRVVLERVVYRRRVRLPSAAWQRLGVRRPFDIYLVALAYRGKHIARAARSFIRQVSQPRGARLRLAGGLTLRTGGLGHVVGYAGHNYLMDVAGVYAWPSFTRRRPVGYFMLACMSAPYLGPQLTRRTTHALLLTRVLMYPGAFTIDGLIRGLALGASQRGVFRLGARYYARFQKRTERLIRRCFTHSGRAAFRRKYPLR
jgi:hypothetical protein